MRDDTAAWLDPIVAAAEAAGIDVDSTMARATVEELDTRAPLIQSLAQYAPERPQVNAVDRVQFGQLLIEQLGWSDYPRYPPYQPPPR